MIRIYNTLTRKKEEFQTLEPSVVKMYVCGVTVYNDAHVGHAMSALVFDIIRRYLEYRGYTVKQVMNYTDVDDKIINRAKQLGEDPLKLSQRYVEDYARDLQNLNVVRATSYPQVSKTMPLIIEFIQGLIRKEAAYAASNGDVYFSVIGDADYGKLSGRKLDDMQAGARIEVGRISPDKSTVFDWKQALDFERQSGPYMQYAHARACSILARAGEFVPSFGPVMESEISLAKHIAKFPGVINNAVNELKPHLVATYARELADLFNVFYQFEPVLKSEGETRQSRLTLVLATKNTLSEALSTLGIEALATM